MIPKLNRKLVLEAAIKLADGAGGFSIQWQPLGTLWADLRAGSGRESAAEFVTLSTVSYRIIVRAAPDGAASRPKPDQRFREGARLYRILAVTEADHAGHYLVCHAREEVPS